MPRVAIHSKADNSPRPAAVWPTRSVEFYHLSDFGKWRDTPLLSLCSSCLDGRQAGKQTLMLEQQFQSTLFRFQRLSFDCNVQVVCPHYTIELWLLWTHSIRIVPIGFFAEHVHASCMSKRSRLIWGRSDFYHVCGFPSNMRCFLSGKQAGPWETSLEYIMRFLPAFFSLCLSQPTRASRGWYRIR